jgi:hypothetical protein
MVLARLEGAQDISGFKLFGTAPVAWVSPKTSPMRLSAKLDWSVSRLLQWTTTSFEP